MRMSRELVTRAHGKNTLFDFYFALAIEKLSVDHEWQKEAELNLGDSFDDWWDAVNDPDAEDFQELYDSPRGLQLPLLTRWQTFLPAISVFLKHRVVFYFIAVQITQREKVGKQLHIYATELIRLMNIRAGNRQPVKGDSSPLVTQLVFLDAFNKAFFGNFFTLACQRDPRFNLPGYFSPLGVERCYVVKRALKELSSPGGLERNDAFNAYFKALKGIPSDGEIKDGNLESFIKMRKTFFDTFSSTYTEHVESCWRHDPKIIVYIIGGDAVLAQWFIRWLIHCEENQGVVENAVSFEFPDMEIEVKHHNTNGDSVKVNVRECMEYIIGKKHAADILPDPLIKDHKDLLYLMAGAEQAVDLFNRETWGTIDYSRLQEMIISKIAIHPAQNQGVESMVLSTKIAGRTNCGEALKSCRVFLHSWIIRPFNKKSLEKKRERVLAKRVELEKLHEEEEHDTNHETETGVPAEQQQSQQQQLSDSQEQSQVKTKADPKVQRTKDHERILGFCDLFDDLNTDIIQLENDAPDEFKLKRKELEQELSSTKSKYSATMLQKEMDIAKKANSKKKRTVYAAEQSSEGMYIPAAVGGAVTLSALLKDQHEAAVDKEIDARKIQLTQPLHKTKWKDKKDLLKIDEHKMLSARPQGLFNPDGSGKMYQQIQEIMP
eukprot:scaffold20456_cov91-Cyclotella_meneghiniana.AAC.1